MYSYKIALYVACELCQFKKKSKMAPLFYLLLFVLFVSSYPIFVLSVQKNQQCNRIAEVQFCTNNSSQEYVDELYRCNKTDAAMEEINQCRYNSNGEFCNLEYTYKLLKNASSACENGGNCSQECNNSLVSVREKLGCCINDFNASRMTSDISGADPLDQSLWERCNVIKPNMACPSRLLEQMDLIVQPSCSDQSITELAYPYLCRRDYREPLRKIFSQSPECVEFEKKELPSCRANQNNEYCEILPLESIFEDAQEACENERKCTGNGCYRILQRLFKEAGCCINEKYNNTDDLSDYNWLSYRFYVECGLESPGHCEERLTSCEAFLCSREASMMLSTKMSSLVKIASFATVAALVTMNLN